MVARTTGCGDGERGLGRRWVVAGTTGCGDGERGLGRRWVVVESRSEWLG